TRSKRDWSSDVCSSDLMQALELILTSVIILTRHHVNGGQGLCIVCRKLRVDGFRSLQELASASQVRHIRVHLAGVDGVVFQTIQIGRASCRGRAASWER